MKPYIAVCFVVADDEVHYHQSVQASLPGSNPIVPFDHCMLYQFRLVDHEFRARKVRDHLTTMLVHIYCYYFTFKFGIQIIK